MAYRPKSIIASWRAQSTATRILRAWLGITWVYGGWNKASDPQFLDPAANNYIGNQIRGFVDISPLGPLLNQSLEHATLAGIFIMIAEFATGFATLFFIVPRFAALAGFFTSFGLWLTVTFHVQPYFLGSDTAYAVMWLTYFFILNNGNKGYRRVDFNMDRRGILRVSSLLGLSGGFIGLGKLFPTAAADSNEKDGQGKSGKRIVKLERLPVGSNFKFKANGQPAMLFRTKTGVFAYSMVCTHQGCVVDYSRGAKQFICPCHGAAFDPFDNGKVLNPPAPKALPKIKVKISGEYVIFA